MNASDKTQIRDEQSGRADAKAIFTHALERVLPEPALRRYLSLNEASHSLIVAGRTYDLRAYKRIIVIGGGFITGQREAWSRRNSTLAWDRSGWKSSTIWSKGCLSSTGSTRRA